MTCPQVPDSPRQLTAARRGPLAAIVQEDTGAGRLSRRKDLLIQAEDRLDQRGQSGRRSGVAQVRLDALPTQRRCAGPSEERPHRLGLLVLVRLAAAVHFQVADRGGIDPGLAVGTLQGGSIGNANPAPPVLSRHRWPPRGHGSRP